MILLSYSELYYIAQILWKLVTRFDSTIKDYTKRSKQAKKETEELQEKKP